MGSATYVEGRRPRTIRERARYRDQTRPPRWMLLAMAALFVAQLVIIWIAL